MKNTLLSGHAVFADVCRAFCKERAQIQRSHERICIHCERESAVFASTRDGVRRGME
jgi:hypothetical protein